MNIFALIIVGLFTLAAIFDLSHGFIARGFFYLLSAAINVAVLYLR